MRLIIGCAVVVLCVAANAAAQVNRCAECHFANFSSVPAAEQLLDWDRSPHAKRNVGCESCHGGDPTTYQPVDAHRGVLNSHNRLSGVSPSNIALTCAPCHSGVVASFRLSTHAALLAADRSGVPTCTTCHGAMAAQVPSAARFETMCADCHRAGSTRGGYPGSARQRIQALRGIEQTLLDLERAIASIEERPRRNRLAAELLLARAAVRNATDAVHSFDFRTMDERRTAAQRRTSEMVADLLGK
jgi:hypothetical protein